MAIRFFVDNFHQFLPSFRVKAASLIAGRSIIEQRRNRGLNRSKRRADVVRDRVEQSGLQRFALSQGFGVAGLLESFAQLFVQALDFAPAPLRFLCAGSGSRR